MNENNESSTIGENLHDVSMNSIAGNLDPDSLINSRISVNINDCNQEENNLNINEEIKSIDELDNDKTE